MVVKSGVMTMVMKYAMAVRLVKAMAITRQMNGISVFRTAQSQNERRGEALTGRPASAVRS